MVPSLNDGFIRARSARASFQAFESQMDNAAALVSDARMRWGIYEQTWNLGELNTVIARLQDAFDLVDASKPQGELTCTGHASLDNIMLQLGIALRTRFKRQGDRQDLWDTIQLLDKSLMLHANDHFARHLALNALGLAYMNRFEELGNSADLEQCLQLLHDALELCPRGHLDRAQILTSLGRACVKLHLLNSRTETIVEASAFHEEALLLRPTGHPQRLLLLDHMCDTSRYCYQQTREAIYLERALETADEAHILCPLHHPKRPKLLANKALSLWLKYSQSRSLEDIEQAVLLCRDALTPSPARHRQHLHFRFLGNLALMLQYRYLHAGSMDDLDEVIKLQREVYAGDTSNDRTICMNNLAASLATRFNSSTDLNQLDEAISLLRDVVKLLPEGHFRLDQTLSNLGETLRSRYEFTGDVANIREAVHVHRRAVDLTRGDHYQRGAYLGALGSTLFALYQHAGDLGDLEEGIKWLRTGLSSGDAVNRPELTTSLATALSSRFTHTHNVQDAREALDLLNGLLESLVDGHTLRASCLFTLSKVYLVPNTPYFNLEASMTSFAEAIVYPYCSPLFRLEDGLEGISLLTQHVSGSASDCTLHERVLQGYCDLIALLPRVAYFGQDLALRLRVLARAENLATKAASFSLAQGRIVNAIETLENGRAVFWTQGLRLRSQFDGLPKELVKRLTSISTELEAGVSLPDVNATKVEVEQEQSRLRRLGEEFECLAAEARSRPGFERFLQSSTFDWLACSAMANPVVLLIASDSDSRAIIITAPSVAPVQIILPGLTAEGAVNLGAKMQAANQHSRKSGFVQERAMIRVTNTAATDKAWHVLAELWVQVMQPILTHLGWKKEQGYNRPRLTICATGPFSHLPVHAAGVCKATRGGWVSEYCVPSYVPTLGVLLHVRRPPNVLRRHETRALLAAAPKPYKWSNLPHARDEIKVIREILPTDLVIAGPLSESYDEATTEDVLRALPDASIVHLACHGHQDPLNALESGFIMRDDTLTLARLMPLRLPNAFLAFLSACETAKGDKKQADQAIHLAAAMLFVGFKSVIGTMWSMGDVDGPEVARVVYTELFEGGTDLLEAHKIPYALDAAVQELRKRKLHPSRWAPYVYLGA